MDSVDMLNALISLSRKQTDGQDALYQLGYKDIRLEYPSGISGGKGVVVDLLLISAAINSFLCIESKSGRHIEVEQGRGYRRVKAQQFATLVSKWHTVSAFSVDVVYICTAANLASIRKGMAEAGLEHAILCFRLPPDEDWASTLGKYPHLGPAMSRLARPCFITLERGKLKNARLAARLSRGIVCDLAQVDEFIGFDLSAKGPRIGRALLHTMSQFAAQGVSTFTTEQLTIAAYGAEAWLKTQRRADLMHHAADILLLAADNSELQRYFGREPNTPREAAKMKWRLDVAAAEVAHFGQIGERFVAALDSKQQGLSAAICTARLLTFNPSYVIILYGNAPTTAVEPVIPIGRGAEVIEPGRTTVRPYPTTSFAWLIGIKAVSATGGLLTRCSRGDDAYVCGGIICPLTLAPKQTQRPKTEPRGGDADHHPSTASNSRPMSP